ncbi:SulP family inorganic anion transporter [Nocardiopsis changdeensis]|uniref:SulP family inorganic anion transporter n=1 Tax=Nocardiopsis changdeensis TaxID=2831969 RepID=UPI003F482DE0
MTAQPSPSRPPRLRSLLPRRADLAAMRRAPGRDLLAGVTVAVVALPLALGFGISSGLGAQAGIVTAIIAGFLAALFGGSNLQVSGPTGAMTVVLVPIVAAHGPGGVLTVGLMAGLILLGLAWARGGRYMRYVPAPVIEGFTLGIAAVIALQQIPFVLGLPQPEGHSVLVGAWHLVRDFAADPDWTPLGIALGTAAVMLLGARWKPTVPFSLLAVAAATALVHLTPLKAPAIGALPAGLPAPSLAFLDPAALGPLLGAAVAVAALAALESLLSATVADGMRVDEHHDPDRELFGQGIANLVTPVFGGVPATAAIARTAVNVRSGAVSRLAAMVHAVVLAVVVLAFAPLVGLVPLAALGGVLLATAVRMVEVGSVRVMMRSTRGDAAVLVLTAVATLALDLVMAVLLGMAVTAALALRSVARNARLDRVELTDGLPGGHDAEERALLDEHIVAYRLDGPLFFAAAHRFLLELTEVADVSAVVLRMSHLSAVDATGAMVLGDAVRRLERRGITVLLSGVRLDHERALRSQGAIEELYAGGLVLETTPAAIAHAHALLRERGTLPA